MKTANDHLLEFKRAGNFDKIRNELFEEFKSSPLYDLFLQRLREIVDERLTGDRSLLEKEKSKAYALIAGAIDRTDLYNNLEKDIQELFPLDSRVDVNQGI